MRRINLGQQRTAIFAALCLFGLFGAPGQSAAQDAQALEALEQELKDRAAEEKRLREEKEAKDKEIAALRSRLVETADSLQNSEREITRIEGSIAALSAEITTTQAALKMQSAQLSEVLAALQSLELSKPPALLVSPDDANEAARAAMLLSDAAPKLEEKAAELRAALARLTTLSEALAAERQAFETSNAQLISRRDILADLMREKEQERDVAARLAVTAQRESAALAARATNLRGVVERLEQVAHAIVPRVKPARLKKPGIDVPVPKTPKPKKDTPPNIAEQTKPSTSPTTSPTTSIVRTARNPLRTTKRFADARGLLKAPVAGAMTGRFGRRRPEGGKFEGVRFTTRDRAIVTAPFEGRVSFARSWDPIGNLLVIDVGGDYHLLLAGVGRFLVDEGQRITAGEPVAEMSGTGAPLDMEIRRKGEPVNPALWLEKARR